MPLQSLKRETPTRDNTVLYFFTMMYAKGLPVKHQTLQLMVMEIDKFLKLDEKDFKVTRCW